MHATNEEPQHVRVVGALAATDASVRLRGALAMGAEPDPGFLEALVQRCAIESDFFVRDMLSWALTRLPPELVLPRLRRELDSGHAQARSQALHTLSKIGDESTWAWITRYLLRDADDEVARTAWRVAVLLVPEDDEEDLVTELVTQLGRGDRTVQLSLSRALLSLGDVVQPALEEAAVSADPGMAAHARATALLLEDPESGFDAALDEARRVLRLGPERAALADEAASGPAGTVDTPESTEPVEAAEATGC